jgi:dienelactone hydrolase
MPLNQIGDLPVVGGVHGNNSSTLHDSAEHGPRTPPFHIRTSGGPTRINLEWESLRSSTVHVKHAAETFAQLRQETIGVYEEFAGSGLAHLHWKVPAWHARLGGLVVSTAATEQSLIEGVAGIERAHQAYREMETTVHQWFHLGVRAGEGSIALEHLAHPDGDRSFFYDWLATMLVTGGGQGLELFLKKNPTLEVLLSTVIAVEDHAGLMPALMGRNEQVITAEIAHTFSHQPDGTLAGHLDNVGRAGDYGDIAVSVIPRPNMEPVYSVHLPGLAADGLNLKHGRSPLSLIDGLTNDSAHMTGAVAEALAEVGAPDGAEVFMTGFSLGGLHATNMAKSSDFQQQYRLRAVTTVGSPARSGPTRPGVKVTHLEDARDPVPHITGDRHEISAERMVIEYNHQNSDSTVESIAGSAHTWEHNVDAIKLMEDNDAEWLSIGELNHVDEFRAQLMFDAEVETHIFESHWQPMDTPEHLMPWEAESLNDLDYLSDALQDGAQELRRQPQD